MCRIIGYEEVDKMAADLTNVTAVLVSRIINIELHVNVIGSLLLEKGIITKDELEDRFDSIRESSFEDIKNDLIRTITESSNED